MSAALDLLFQFGDAFAFLVLSAAGLAIIFGLMGVINLAHGEFIMCGAYVTVVAARAGLPLPLAIALAAVITGAVGMLLERLIVRRLYGRPLDSIVATWGISLIAAQGTLIVLGSSLPGIPTPFGSVAVAGSSFPVYRLLLIAIAAALLGALYTLFTYTRFGVLARATMALPYMAEALGVDTGRLYGLTFGLGAALAGLAGGLYAPTVTIVPTMGASFLLEAFATVVIGGADVLVGAAPAAAALGVVKAGVTAWRGQLFGEIALLLAVIVTVRVLPLGMSGWLGRERA